MPDILRFGAKPLSNKQFVDKLKSIVKNYPFYYPAYLDMGCRLLRINIQQATEALDIGYGICIMVSDFETIDKDYYIVFENLEMLIHPEFVVRYALQLIEKFPYKAVFYDSAAYAFASLGEKEQALAFGKKAVGLSPKNSYFLNNLGMYYLELKMYDEAEKCFKLSIKAEKKHVNPVNNLATCAKMRALGLSGKEYCLLPIDKNTIRELKKDSDSDMLQEYVDNVNQFKMLALKDALAEKSQNKVHTFDRLFKALSVFFHFIESISDEYFIYEEVVYVHINFESIMHMFIIRHNDVNEQIVNEIYQSLYLFYGYLSENEIILNKHFEAFKEKADSLKIGLLDKVNKYNKVRNGLGDNWKAKAETLEKLFGDDSDREVIF
jgi:tetratricopeptide (TPR) repeat protein